MPPEVNPGSEHASEGKRTPKLTLRVQKPSQDRPKITLTIRADQEDDQEDPANKMHAEPEAVMPRTTGFWPPDDLQIGSVRVQ